MATAEGETLHSEDTSENTIDTSENTIDIVTFNVDGHPNCKDRVTPMRNIVTKAVSNSGTNLFLLCQEISVPRTRFTAVQDSQLRLMLHDPAYKYNTEAYKKEAGIYPLKQSLVYGWLSNSELKAVLGGMKLGARDDFCDFCLPSLEEKCRLEACCVKLGTKRMLLVSWHGPETKVDHNIQRKRHCFKMLCVFLEELKEKLKPPCNIVLVGGDFNFSATEALNSLQEAKGFNTDLVEWWKVENCRENEMDELNARKSKISEKLAQGRKNHDELYGYNTYTYNNSPERHSYLQQMGELNAKLETLPGGGEYRDPRKNIDYVVYWPADSLKCSRREEIHDEEDQQIRLSRSAFLERPFDHPVIHFTFKLL